jgi:hypothetical protein
MCNTHRTNFSCNEILHDVAWLAGLLTPGAPAGVGVREIMLLFLLGTVVGRADLLLAAVLSRVITVTGDGGFFVWASLKGRER